jgi:prolyl oligopeptidase
MNMRNLIVCVLIAIGFAVARGDESPPAAPPVATVRPVTDDDFGIKIVDPYRYMENLQDPQVRDWVKAQADYARATLDRIPGRGQLLEDIHKFANAAPARVGSVHRLASGQYFYLKTLATQNLAKLYMRQGLDGAEKLLVDTDQFAAANGAPAAINFYEPSPDGRFVAFGVSQGGAEIGELRVLDVSSGKQTGEIIDRVWDAEVSWRPDDKSFFFTRLQKLGKNASPLELEQKSKTYLHVVGQSPDQDVPVLGIDLSPNVPIDPVDGPGVATQVGCDYAVGVISHGVQRELTLYVAPLAAVGEKTPWKKVCDVNADVTSFDMHGDDLILLTHQDAPRFKLLQTSLSHPDIAHAATLLPQRAGVLRGTTVAADALYATELDGGIVHALRIPYGGTAEAPKMPYDANVGVYGGDPRVPGVVLSLSAWTRAGQIFEYDPKDNHVRPTDLQPSGPYDHPADLISQEVNATSYDGAQVPLSIIMRRGTKFDGSNPTQLVAYGAYGIMLDANFNPGNLAWFNRGGIIAIAHVAEIPGRVGRLGRGNYRGPHHHRAPGPLRRRHRTLGIDERAAR